MSHRWGSAPPPSSSRSPEQAKRRTVEVNLVDDGADGRAVVEDADTGPEVSIEARKGHCDVPVGVDVLT